MQDRKLVIDKKYAELVKFMYNKFLQTESYFEIAKILNTAGYKTRVQSQKNGKIIGGNKFEPKAVLRILRNPYYKGCVTHKGNVYPGEHEAIIDEAVWEEVQKIFAAHAKPELKEKRKRSSSPTFLRGLLRCSCGALMRQTCTSKRGVKYRYYGCTNHFKYGGCSCHQTPFPAEPIEKNVLAEIVKILKSPEVVISINNLAAKRNDLDKKDLASALKNLNEVINYLHPTELHKIANMLIRSITVSERGLKLDLNLDGFDALIMQLAS